MIEETKEELQRDPETWLKKVIDSCSNTVHFLYAEKLVELYKAQTDNEDDIHDIEMYFTDHYNAIHGITVQTIK